MIGWKKKGKVNFSFPSNRSTPLSITSVLWSSYWTINKLGACPRIQDKYVGTVMILDSSQRQGDILAKLLSRTWTQIVLVSSNTKKSISLRESIRSIAPFCRVQISKTSTSFEKIADLVICTTTDTPQIERLKPGCVICSATPQTSIDINKLRQRPDIIHISGGDLELPSSEVMKAINKRLNYQNIIDTDRISRDHNIRISSLRCNNLELTEEEIDLCKQHIIRQNNHNQGNQHGHTL